MSALENLSPDEITFVELFLARQANRMPIYLCYRNAFGADDLTDAYCSVRASQLRKQPRIVAAMRELSREVVHDAVASLGEIREFFTLVQRGAGAQLADCVSWEVVPGEHDGTYESIPIVTDPLDIPPEHQVLVKNFELLHDGRYRVQFWPDPQTKERIRSAELLAKMQGGFVDQIQVTADVEQKTVSRDMTPEEATDIYRQMLRRKKD